jgi:hypothetical protein
MGEAFTTAAPWDLVPPEKTLFALVTGANRYAPEAKIASALKPRLPFLNYV